MPDPGNVRWTDDVDAVFASDQAIALATVTPAKGVVIMPVTNFAVRDREAGTLTAVNSSIAVPKKLERMRDDPHVTLAYHTRTHCFEEPRPEYVLVQGLATLSDPDPRYMDTIRPSFDKYAGGHPRGGFLWEWWLSGWHTRVGVTLGVRRIVVWPQLSCHGTPVVLDAPLPGAPAPQAPPGKGTAPRLDHRAAARAAAKLPEALLGWTGADGFPVVVPVEVKGADERGILLEPPPGLVPPGGRRAGFTAHWFGKYNVGQNQKIHTGWMELDHDGTVVYAPHTKAGYHMPPSKLLYRIFAGGYTLARRREGRRRGFAPAAET